MATSSKQSYDRKFMNAELGMQNELGPLELLPGKWRANGTGWNMIALPFRDPPQMTAPYRILMNQYDEELSFFFVDDNVANRGLHVDQRVSAIDYQQEIRQIAVDDFPESTERGHDGLGIHHEPGLFIWVKDNQTADINIARLASIPHGNSALCLGSGKRVDGMPEIPRVNALPIGRFEDISTPGYDLFNDSDDYLLPYRHYTEMPFFGKVPKDHPTFPGFNPVDMTQILRFANDQLIASGATIDRTTVLSVDSTVEDAGIRNMPFVTREAEPVSMRSTFWVQEVTTPEGESKLRMQYMQVVMIDFFANREDQLPGRAQWPHISIATLERE